jgi:hypothetical protein
MSVRGFMFYHLLAAIHKSCKPFDEILVGHVSLLPLILQLYVACLLLLYISCVWR